MPPDINENYDPPVDDRAAERRHGLRIDAEVLRTQGAQSGGQLFIDAEVLRSQGRSTTHEPPIYTVVSFRVRHPGGEKTYDYAAVRAGDGRWYVTGGETKQGVSWEVLTGAVRERLVGPMQVLAPVRSVFL